MKFKRSSLMAKIIVILPAIAAVITLVSIENQLSEKREQIESLTSQVESVSQETQRLKESIELADTDEGLKEIARERLGMVANGEIVFYDIGG